MQSNLINLIRSVLEPRDARLTLLADGRVTMLDEEVALFGKMKPELLRDHKGKFALIKGAQFVGAYDSVEDAYWKGVNRFGQESFLVKKIIE